MMYDPTLVVPPEVVRAVSTIREFAMKHTAGNDWQILGLQPVAASIGYYKAKMESAERQLDEVTKERDQLHAMLNLADALRNRERGISKC